MSDEAIHLLGLPKKHTYGLGAKFYKSANQTISNALWTKILHEVEVWDDLGEFDPATNIFTPLKTGRYFIAMQITFSDMTDGADVETQFLARAPPATHTVMFLMTRPGGATWMSLAGSTIAKLYAGYTYRHEVYQASGASRTLRGDGNEHYTFCAIARLF